MNYWIIPSIKTQPPEPNIEAIPQFPKRTNGKRGLVTRDITNEVYAVVYVLHKHGWSDGKIGKHLGNRDRSSVLYGRNKFKDLLSINDEVALKLEMEYRLKLFTYDYKNN